MDRSLNRQPWHTVLRIWPECIEEDRAQLVSGLRVCGSLSEVWVWAGGAWSFYGSGLGLAISSW